MSEIKKIYLICNHFQKTKKKKFHKKLYWILTSDFDKSESENQVYCTKIDSGGWCIDTDLKIIQKYGPFKLRVQAE